MEKLDSSHEDIINLNYVKQLLIFRCKYLHRAFNLRMQLISFFQRLSRIYRAFVWKALI